MVFFGSSKTSSSLRRRRKWPFSPYKGKWQQTFNEQQAMEELKKAAVKEEQNPKTNLLSLLIASFSSYGCDPNPSAYSFIINHLSQRSLLSQLSPVLDRLERIEKFNPPERMFVDLIRSYGNAGMLHDAIELFYRIPRLRCAPTVHSLNTLLAVLCRKEDNFVLVHDVLMRTLEMNVRLEYSTFWILVKALCRFGKVNSATELLNTMALEVHGCTPDSRLYSMILSSLCKHAGSLEVVNFLEEMRKAGFSPNGREYTNVINVLVKEGRAKDAFDVLNRMKVDGIKPDIVSYTSVLDGFFSAGDFQKGEEVFDEMLVMGLVPDAFTYSVYINGLCKKGDFDGALDMTIRMEQVGCKPDVVAYNTIMMALCKVGDVGRARVLMGKMGLKGVEGNLHTYRVLIDGLVCKGAMAAAFEMLVEMLERGFVPRAATLDLMICGLCECRLFSEAVRVLEEMLGRSVAPEARAWESLLSCVEFDSGCSDTLTDLELLTWPLTD
ncbi:pentatricopeptide repeat-containing protein At2g38420, mitochondrial-like [Magnolia sinica]|uniref:pentatricopeptide repeat-containing protein At2g38420, mitochondrial-like n=1 Tax=Magnolia sinica TaxID=86752 RepID=UPI00265AFCF5|nr:pentatricopeptide repeat-containing protein At2g38420, mitochondrial-like [Magnolia sinica]